jgi:hypothetical protein
MSNTPETEKVKAALHTNWYDLLNHARKLERERDEAINTIVGWENKWRYAVEMAARAELERDDALDDAKKYHIKMVGLINERDDAREDARLLSERLTALELESTAELARLEQELINMKELYESNN